jgi:formylmethanofuran dehydrogenase subunit B
MAEVPAVVIGPRASAATEARVAIDTGVAGIHEPGIGYRMDEVPLPLTPMLDTPRGAAETLGRLLSALRARSAGGPP